MKLRRIILSSVALICFSFLLISWGSQGHKLISGYTFLSFNDEMSQFNAWKTFLVDHSSDADSRRSSDPDEAPKHYIDIDNYPEFVSTGEIEPDLNKLILIHNRDFIIDNGVLPWATVFAYDSLVSSFKRRDWTKAKIFAADLGHYVGDGYMPLHITKNYDGKLTGNGGIHSLYETSMISSYAASIAYARDSLHVIGDVPSYIFNYIYSNYKYVDSVLIADTYARSVSSGTSTSAYRAALWLKTGNFTTNLFKGASHSLAELFYTAWVNAGRPMISGGYYFTGVQSVQSNAGISFKGISPNPAIGSAEILYTIDKPSKIKIEIFDSLGRSIVTLVDSTYSQPGDYSCSWTGSNPPGMYFVCLKSEEARLIKRLIITR